MLVSGFKLKYKLKYVKAKAAMECPYWNPLNVLTRMHKRKTKKDTLPEVLVISNH